MNTFVKISFLGIFQRPDVSGAFLFVLYYIIGTCSQLLQGYPERTEHSEIYSSESKCHVNISRG